MQKKNCFTRSVLLFYDLDKNRPFYITWGQVEEEKQAKLPF